jgi:hypothetical protein
MLRVDTERRFLPQFKNQGLAPSNVSIKSKKVAMPQFVKSFSISLESIKGMAYINGTNMELRT